MILKKFKQYRVLGLAALLLMSMIAGTWAYWTQTQQALNEFQAGKYSTNLVEEFVPPDEWMPGEEVNKDVKVTNTGTVPVFASITISQEWLRRENVYDVDGKVILPAAGDAFPNTFDGTEGKEYAALIKWGKDVVLLSSGKTKEASLSLGIPTVNSVEDARGKWLLVSETPDSNGNFTFYYIGVVVSNSETPILLDGVEMNPEIQAIILAENTVWNKETKEWVTTTVQNPTHDYQNAHFTLGVKMNTVQATAEAMKEMFGSDTNSSQEVIAYLESISVLGKDVDYSRDNNVKEKKLYLSANNGVLTYTPATPGENWFMSHLNMMPGEIYEDILQIENQTNRNYTMFMQVVEKDGFTEGLPKELLELIHMKVYYGEELIYDGTALGKDYNGSIRNLQNVISLGKYASGVKSKIRVVLQLDKNTSLEYADLLTQIDWKFMVEEKTTNVTPVNPPKTGDTNNRVLYIAFMVFSGVALAGLILYDKRERKKRQSN